VIQYRTFRNGDPPGLADVWNACFTGRAAVRLQGPAWLEYFTFAKPYFDPAGLFVALGEGKAVGFAHAGFGPDETEAALDQAAGVLCLLGVAPSHRRQGVGSELLRRCEEYLKERGARSLTAGPVAPANPFTFGLYGGSASAGFLDSDPLARPFFERHGYRAEEVAAVFQRRLDRPVESPDGRFAAHRLRYEIQAGPCTHLTWWLECVAGPLELHEYRLTDRLTAHTAARAVLWEMEPFAPRWNEHPVGVLRLEVEPAMRRQGLAKFLLAQSLRHLREQYFGLVEVHAPPGDVAAAGLLRGLGFEQVDTGRRFLKPVEAPAP
jgi:ribosomal protein S18 acetylase RimI-like enzyme